jgi:hypothetical protein
MIGAPQGIAAVRYGYDVGVVGHQAICINPHPEFSGSFSKKPQVDTTIFVIPEEV